MALYFVVEDSDPEFSRDLLVVAPNIRWAIAYWSDYYETDEPDSPEKIFEINAPTTPGPLAWDEEHCKLVWELK